MKIKLEGDGSLFKALTRLKDIDMDAVIMDNLKDIYNRGKAPGGTPVRTGELRASLTIMSKDEVGYRKEYAKPVEYGHTTRGGGYVSGRFYLKANVEKQRPILKKKVLEAIKKAGDK